jgi:hypothetical protein
MLDPQRGLKLANAGIIVWFRLSNPDGIVTLNMRDEPLRRGIYVDYVLGECDNEPDIIFEVSSDLGNRSLQGKVNIIKALMEGQIKAKALIHHQGIICGVAFDPSSLRRIAPYASVVAPRRLASNTVLVVRNTP